MNKGLDINNMTIRTGTENDRRELLYLWEEYILRHRFLRGWQAIEYHIFEDNRFEWYRHCLVVEKDGRIVAALALIPMVMNIANILIKVGVITGVVTIPEFRKQGLMTFLMQRAGNKMFEEKQLLGLLWGYRDRYKHFGFELCGKRNRYFVPRRKFSNITEAEKDKIREVEWQKDEGFVEKLANFNNLYLSGLSGYRSRVFKRAVLNSYIFDDNDNPAIVTINNSPVAESGHLEIYYANGRFQEIMAILNMLMVSPQYKECVFVGEPLLSEGEDRFYNFYEWFNSEHICNVRINDFLDLMKHLEPYFSLKASNAGCDIKLSMTRNSQEATWTLQSNAKISSVRRYEGTFSDTEIVRILFGSEKPSELPFVKEEDSLLDDFFPVPFKILPFEGV